MADRLETTRGGQLRLDVPGLNRWPYPTGQQTSCERCAAAGVARLGVSRAGPASPPLCVPCWRSDQDRQNRAARRRQVAQGWDEIADLDCPVCGPGPSDVGCWWCGDRAWLDGLRWVHERDQAAAAAAEAARVDAEFARLAAVAESEARIKDLTKWITRILRDVLARWRDGSGGRAVDRAAAELEAMDAARTSARGRPPIARELVAVMMAVDADWRSGRRAMPGQARMAWLCGVSTSATFNAIQHLIAVAGVRQTHRGGRNPLARRVATGRWNDRSVYDLPPLARTVAARAGRARHIPRVLVLLAMLLDRAQTLLDAEYVELDRLRAGAAGPPTWTEQAARANDRQATRRASAGAAALAEEGPTGPNKCEPHPVSKGECVSSCSYRGLLFTRPTVIHSPECPAGPAAGRRGSGASRSPTKKIPPGGHAVPGVLPGQAPAPAQRHSAGPFGARDGSVAPRRRVRPSWASWAYDLARELIPSVPWLADAWLPGPDGRNRLLPCVAATFGPRLGPAWTATAVRAYLPDEIAAIDPLAVLAAALDRALTGDQAPPYPARRYEEHRRAIAAAAHAAESARLAGTLAELDTHAAGSTGAGLAVFRATRAQLGHRSPAGEAWPAVAQPGSGLPANWRHGDDRAEPTDDTPPSHRSRRSNASTHLVSTDPEGTA